METKWLEDFVSLAETHSFSRSAALRHVTQPAFSRRIQALEAWVGVELIDRSGYPTRLTQAGNVFHAQALAMLSQARDVRSMLRGQGAADAARLDFSVPHTLSLTFFPRWIEAIDQRVGGARRPVTGHAEPVALCPGGRLHARLRALNVHDAVLTLTEGGCDLMMGYHHPSYPVVLDPRRYSFLVLGTETISPFCAPHARANAAAAAVPRFALPGAPARPIPYLAYSSNAYLGRMTEVLMAQAGQPLFLDTVYETDMAEGLKLMALAGHGVAFLPHSAVGQALAAGMLIPPDLPRDHEPAAFSLTMEIRLYRDQLAESSPARKALLDAVWSAAESLAEREPA